MNELQDLLTPTPIPEHAHDVKHTAHTFATDEIRPNASHYADTGDYPWNILEAGYSHDLIASDIPTEYGGQNYDLAQTTAMAEEFFRADAGIGLTMMLASFGAEIVEQYGTDTQKETYLTPVANGDCVTGLGVSEPQTGSDLAGMTTTAEKDGDEYVLNGEKYWIGNGVEADWITLYAKTADKDDRYSNYSLFIVPTDTDGYHAEHIPEKIAMRASKQAHIVLEDARIPDENLIGTEGAGFYMLADFFNHGRVVVGAQGIGLAAAAIEEAWSFIHDREAFGKHVNEFQAVQHKLADMRLKFEQARALLWTAFEHVQDNSQAGFWAAMAKTAGTEAATYCAEHAMQLHGGRSILKENRISRVYQDVRIPVIYEGANDIQRNLMYEQTPTK